MQALVRGRGSDRGADGDDFGTDARNRIDEKLDVGGSTDLRDHVEIVEPAGGGLMVDHRDMRESPAESRSASVAGAMGSPQASDSVAWSMPMHSPAIFVIRSP